MARIDDLVARIADQALRRDIERAVADLRSRKQFGLVFEEHIPETVSLSDFPVRPGAFVQRREDVRGDHVFRVAAVSDTDATLLLDDRAEAQTAKLSDLVVVKRFGEAIYPGLASLGKIAGGGSDATHAVINGENYHALQLLDYSIRGQVDLIYIDPPYNTGSRDWKYNNDYVDKNDAWRHSKWLSFMEKRLLIAKRLLSSSGVIVIAIDENEHAHMVLLLEKLFPAYSITSVAVVHNPRGVQGDNFSYTHEFAVFVIPSGSKSIAERKLNPEEVVRNTSPLRNWAENRSGMTRRTAFIPYM
jgi:adenine-specific DNA-methyltransferase